MRSWDERIAALRLLFCFQISEILQIIRMIGNTNGIDFEFDFDDDFGIVFECKIYKLLIIY